MHLPTDDEDLIETPYTIDDEADPVWLVRDSGIHDRGVFATRDIEKDAEIIQYIGERITHEVADERGLAWEDEAREAGIGAVYLFTLDENWVIDGNLENNPARLLNHSCSPNCESVICGDGEEAEIWLVAKKKIKKGAELTFDYGFDLENYESHPCRCGTKNCAGFIVGEGYREELARLLKAKAKKKKKKKKSGEKKPPKSQKGKKSGEKSAKKDKKKRK